MVISNQGSQKKYIQFGYIKNGCKRCWPKHPVRYSIQVLRDNSLPIVTENSGRNLFPLSFIILRSYVFTDKSIIPSLRFCACYLKLISSHKYNQNTHAASINIALLPVITYWPYFCGKFYMHC
jgi:hypothetical protein